MMPRILPQPGRAPRPPTGPPRTARTRPMFRTLLALLPLLALPAPAPAATAAVVVLDQKTDLDTLKDTTKQPGQRIVAARALVSSMGTKIADEFIDMGPKATTPPDL